MLELVLQTPGTLGTMSDLEESEFLLRNMDFTPVSSTVEAKGLYADSPSPDGQGSMEPQPDQLPSSSSEELPEAMLNSRKNSAGNKIAFPLFIFLHAVDLLQYFFKTIFTLTFEVKNSRHEVLFM